jgi:hypothetical protein
MLLSHAQNEHVVSCVKKIATQSGKTCHFDRRYLGKLVSLFVGVYGLFLNLSLLKNMCFPSEVV